MTPRDLEGEIRRFAEAMARAGAAWRRAGAAWQRLQAAAREPRLRQSLRLLGIILQNRRVIVRTAGERLRLVGWMLREIKAAERNPGHPKARAWLALRGLTPRELATFLPSMLMEFEGDLTVPKPRGGQAGARPASSSMVEQLAARIARTGERPTTAARRVLADNGARGDLKGRADALVRLLDRERF